MNAIRLPYWKLLVEKASGRSLLTRQGNSIWHNLAANAPDPSAITNLVWWAQPGLNCFTPAPHFHAVHSVLPDTLQQTDLAGQTVLYAAPPPSTRYPQAEWGRVSGTALVRSVVPDGPLPVAFLKILPPADGSLWAYATTKLPAGWKYGKNAVGEASLPENGSVAVTLRFGGGDQAPSGGAAIDGPALTAGTPGGDPLGDPGVAPAPLVVRVMVGNLWAITFPQDGSAPFFEKKFHHKDKNGNTREWTKLHTFADAAASVLQDGRHEWLVSFVAFAGRIMVSVSGRQLNTSSFVYAEVNPKKKGVLKGLTIPSAPLRIVGATNDGAPVYVALRRIGWGGGGSYQASLTLNAAVGNASELTFQSFGYIPDFIPGLSDGAVRQPTFEASLASPTRLTYTAFVPATDDDREPCALKWVWASSPRVATPESGQFVDYGPAIQGFVEEIAEPAFGGDATTVAFAATNSLTFSRAALDLVAAQNNTDWRQDLAAFSPATWITGNFVQSDKDCTSQGETTRIQGYLMSARADYDEFSMGTVTRELHDPSIRYKNPAGFIDTRYHPLDFLDPSTYAEGKPNLFNIYGVDAVRYILGQAVDPHLAASLKAYFPADWYPLFNEDALILGQGTLPANDLPLWSPPYGSYAESWLKEIQEFDFACLYFAGLVPVYGQYQEIVKNTPVWDIYDGADASGVPVVGNLPDAQQPWVCVKGGTSRDVPHDFNRVVIWGAPPGGINAGTDGKPFGAPLIVSQATDFLRVAQTWERTDLNQGGKFFLQDYADRAATNVLRQYGGASASTHYKVTLPFMKPEVFWGHKMRFHTTLSLPELNGKTLRVLKMTTTGQNGGDTGRKAETTFDLIELLADEG